MPTVVLLCLTHEVFMNAPIATPVFDPLSMRKFDTADLTVHGSWLLPRMIKTFPHLNERGAASILQSILYDNEYCFQVQADSVGLAQVITSHALTSPQPILQERFVWCRDPEDKEQQKQAATFYDQFSRWAKLKGIDIMLVEESSDVPHDMIKERFGRLFVRQQQFARL
jgi:hypothetical protein